MIIRLIANGIDNYGKLLNEHKAKTNIRLWLDVAQIANSFPKEWKQIMMRTAREHPATQNQTCAKMNIWKHVENITTREIRCRKEKYCIVKHASA